MALVVRDRELLGERSRAPSDALTLARLRLHGLRDALRTVLRRGLLWLSHRSCGVLDHAWEESWPSARRVCRRCARVETLESGCGVRQGHRGRTRS